MDPSLRRTRPPHKHHLQVFYHAIQNLPFSSFFTFGLMLQHLGFEERIISPRAQLAHGHDIFLILVEEDNNCRQLSIALFNLVLMV